MFTSFRFHYLLLLLLVTTIKDLLIQLWSKGLFLL